MKNLTQHTGKFITSMGYVLWVMVATIAGMTFFSHTFFLRVYPADLRPAEALTASWILAVAWESTVLLTTVNVRHLSKRVPVVMAIASGQIVLFFLEGFDHTQSSLMLLQRWFTASLFGYMNYIFAEVFYQRWQVYISQLPEAAQSNRIAELEAENAQKTALLNQTQSKLNQVQSAFNQVQSTLNQLQSQLVCPHCKEQFQSYGTLHAHKGHCSANPKKKILNGNVH